MRRAPAQYHFTFPERPPRTGKARGGHEYGLGRPPCGLLRDCVGLLYFLPCFPSFPSNPSLPTSLMSGSFCRARCK